MNGRTSVPQRPRVDERDVHAAGPHKRDLRIDHQVHRIDDVVHPHHVRFRDVRSLNPQRTAVRPGRERPREQIAATGRGSVREQVRIPEHSDAGTRAARHRDRGVDIAQRRDTRDVPVRSRADRRAGAREVRAEPLGSRVQADLGWPWAGARDLQRLTVRALPVMVGDSRAARHERPGVPGTARAQGLLTIALAAPKPGGGGLRLLLSFRAGYRVARPGRPCPSPVSATGGVRRCGPPRRKAHAHRECP